LDAGYDCLPADPTTGLNDWGTQVPAAAQTLGSDWWRLPIILEGAERSRNTAEGVTNFITNIPGPLTMNHRPTGETSFFGRYGSLFGRYTHAKYVNSNLYNSSSIDYGIEQYFQTEDSWMFGHTSASGRPM